LRLRKKPEVTIKPYDKVITKMQYLMMVCLWCIEVEKKYYFEIPNKLLDKDMLLVSRLSKLPSNLGGGYVNAGSETNEQLVIWQRFKIKF
jgi:hypothetical protein